MSRFDEAENALIQRLRALKAKPEVTINLLDVIERLGVDGFTPGEITAVLRALEQDGVIAFATAKPNPDPSRRWPESSAEGAPARGRANTVLADIWINWLLALIGFQ